MVETHTMNNEHYFLPSEFQFPSLSSAFSPIIIKQGVAYWGVGWGKEALILALINTVASLNYPSYLLSERERERLREQWLPSQRWPCSNLQNV